MNLLPKTREEFRSKDYWDEFFRKRTNAFEWYGQYNELCGVLDKYCKLKEKLLMIGCGNSQLSEDLYDVGYRHLINIDISEVVIKQMKEKNKELRGDMEFIKMDMLEMDFEARTFSVVIDKGTLDAIFTDSSPKVIEDVNGMFKEVSRVLRFGGRYICVTLAQEHILNKLLDHFTTGWFVRVHRIMANSTDKQVSPLPVFAFIFTKTKFAEDNNDASKGIQLLEVCLNGTDNIQRVSCADEIRKAVRDVQHFAMIKQQIGKMHPGESFTMELWDEKIKNISDTNKMDATCEPRYTLTVKDVPHAVAKNGKFAIFIIPQGRETEWHFASKEGQNQLAVDAGFERLVIVSLSRRHTYSAMDAVKAELSSKVMELAPSGVSHKTQVPFLSLGDDVGSRRIVHEAHSVLSGGFVVEEVIGDRGQKFRRLIFLNHRTAIQSEAKIVTDLMNQVGRENKNKKKKKRPATKPEVVDVSYLACGHHRVMVTSLALMEGFLDSNNNKKILLVGLGGGGLPMFMHQYFPQLYLEVVELDPSVVEIAQNWFGFVRDERVTVRISDGLEFITLQSSKEPRPSYDIIMFDIDSKDTSEGLVSPPEAFIEVNFLASVKYILSPSGVFVLNLGCRSADQRMTILNNIRKVFPELYTLNIEEEINEVVFCLPERRLMKEHSTSFKEMKHSFQKMARDLEKRAKEQTKERWDSTLDFCQSLENLKLFD